MLSKDMIIGIAGAVVLAGAMIGIIVYESATFADGSGGPAGGTLYSVGFVEKSETFTYPGTVESGAPHTGNNTIAIRNVTRIVFRLAWQDDETTLTGEDTFTMKVTAPSGASVSFSPSQSVSSDSGDITITAALSNLPDAKKVVAAQSANEAANAAFGDGLASDNGIGEWLAELQVASGGSVPLLPADTGNAYSLEMTVFHYEPQASRVEDDAAGILDK